MLVYNFYFQCSPSWHQTHVSIHQQALVYFLQEDLCLNHSSTLTTEACTLLLTFRVFRTSCANIHRCLIWAGACWKSTNEIVLAHLCVHGCIPTNSNDAHTQNGFLPFIIQADKHHWVLSHGILRATHTILDCTPNHCSFSSQQL